MKVGRCKDTCAPGEQFYVAGREYLVDETDRFIARHFEFPAEPEAPEEPAAPAVKRGKK